MTKQKIKEFRSVAVIALMSLILLWQNIEQSPWREKEVIQTDAKVYHIYLPATIINKDPFLELETHDKIKRYGTHTSPIGRNAVKMSMGVAMMNLPFFYGGHLYALSNDNYAVDGYSEPYQLAISLSSVFYMILGLVFLWLVLKRTFSDLTSLLTILFIGVGTNLYYYSIYETGLSHPCTFFLLSVLLYLIHNWLSQKKIWKSILMGAILGLIVLVRPINILFILPLILLFKTQDLKWSVYLKQLFLPFSYVLAIVLGGVLIILPQLIFWKIQTGSLVYYTYGDEGFFWSNPHIWEGLFSFRKGWFIYTPLVLFALFGMVRLYRIQKMYFWAIAFFLPLFLYITFSWWSWWYGGSFGARTLIDILPFMAFPLAALIDWIFQKRWRLIILIIPLYFVYVNLYQSWQYSHKMLHYDSMTFEGYKTIFLKHYTPDEYWGQLRKPDYDNALKYGIEKVSLPILNDPVPTFSEEDIQNMIEYIKTDEKWIKEIELKAMDRNQSVDSVLRNHVIWLFENKKVK
jgi:hypothetical protein